MTILLSLAWGICPIRATFAVHTIVTLKARCHGDSLRAASASGK
jgi:hypothetical protein